MRPYTSKNALDKFGLTIVLIAAPAQHMILFELEYRRHSRLLSATLHDGLFFLIIHQVIAPVKGEFQKILGGRGMADQTATPGPAKLPCPLPAWDGPSKVFEPLTGQPAARGLGGSTGAGVRETCWPPANPHA